MAQELALPLASRAAPSAAMMRGEAEAETILVGTEQGDGETATAESGLAQHVVSLRGSDTAGSGDCGSVSNIS